MTLVFDAQALLAHAFDEAGADVVDVLLHRVAEGAEGAVCSVVNYAEVAYILMRRHPERARTYLDWLKAAGVEEASADDVWRDAASIKAAHPVSLGDAFAMATARKREGTLVTGADRDFDVAPDLGIRLQRIQ